MAAPGGKFFIQENIKKVAPHHESYGQLWKTKWAFPVRRQHKEPFEVKTNDFHRPIWASTHSCSDVQKISPKS
jgi:hypothetical protein